MDDSWSTDSEFGLENMDVYKLMGKLKKLEDNSKWLGDDESQTEDFYKIRSEAMAVAQSFLEEGILNKTMVKNLNSLVRGKKQTMKLVKHFNFCFQSMYSRIAELDQAISIDKDPKHIFQELPICFLIVQLHALAGFAGGIKIQRQANKMMKVFEERDNLNATKSALEDFRKAVDILFDKLDAYFKVGVVKLGLPSSLTRISESESSSEPSFKRARKSSD